MFVRFVLVYQLTPLRRPAKLVAYGIYTEASFPKRLYS
jgi:hypothetical protein